MNENKVRRQKWNLKKVRRLVLHFSQKKKIHHKPRESVTFEWVKSERKALSFTLPSPSHWPQVSKFVLRFTGGLNKEMRGKSKKWGSR